MFFLVRAVVDEPSDEVGGARGANGTKKEADEHVRGEQSEHFQSDGTALQRHTKNGPKVRT